MGFAYEVLLVALKDYRFDQEAALNELVAVYELQSGCALSGKMGLVRANLPYSTIFAMSQADCAHGEFSEN